MKNRTLLFSFAVLPLAALLMVLITSGEKERAYTPRDHAAFKSASGAAEYWKMIRNNQITGTVDPADVQMAIKQMAQLSPTKSFSWTWDEMGPDNLGGRTRAIIFDRNNPATMYAGSVTGGLWKSVSSGSSWTQITSLSENLTVASLVQAPNGDIYVGTGEGFYAGYGTGTGGFMGNGVYKSTDGVNFVHLAQTAAGTTKGWEYTNEMKAHPTNGRIYAATNKGLKISGDGGATWDQITITLSPTTPNNNADDVEIASDGTVFAVINRNLFVATNGTDFTRISGTGMTLPTAVSRMEIAIAPSDVNYVYAVVIGAQENHTGIYRSTDKGSTWTQIAPASTTNFNIYRNQGSYNNAIEVFPNNKDKILVGGIDIWTWQFGGTWTQITSGSFSETSPLYVHVDIHEFAFHPTNPDIVFVGCDGGIHRSINGAQTWAMMNKNYSTIQYYAITSSGSGQVLGGTQDNSYQFIDFKGNTPRSARELSSGDGGYAAISQINPRAYFMASQYGMAVRTADGGATYQRAYKGTSATTPEFFNARMLAEGTPGTNFSHFVTPLALWESHEVYDALDSLMFIADTNYLAGEIITVRIPHTGYPVRHTLLAALSKDDTMMIQNPVQSMFILASRTAIWMTRQPLDFSGTPTWFKLGTAPASIITVTISNDGNHIFAGTSGGSVIRFSNIRQAYDSLSADMGSTANPNLAQVVTRTQIANYSGRSVTSIAVDPTNNDHVVITLGNYGNNLYVYRSTDATSASPSFASKQSTLPKFPVYASLIPMHKSNTLIVGTEFGTFVTENLSAANPTWTEINDGMDRVPTLMLHQQIRSFPYDYAIAGEGDDIIVVEFPATTNYGGIYAGTHGRGAFRNLQFVGIQKPAAQKPDLFRSQLLVYPNPVQTNATAVVNLSSSARATVRVYDLTGRIVVTADAGMLNTGRNEINLDLAHLKGGNYIVTVTAAGETKSAKILKR